MDGMVIFPVAASLGGVSSALPPEHGWGRPALELVPPWLAHSVLLCSRPFRYQPPGRSGLLCARPRGTENTRYSRGRL